MPILEALPAVSFNNILLATDFSPASDKALMYARAFAREHDSAVYTVHVSAPDEYQLLCPEAFAESFNGLDEDSVAGSAILRSLLRGLPNEAPVQGGEIWKIVKDVAARNDIDFLIVGTHARNGVQKVLLGSVAEEVFRDVPCPVLTVGKKTRKPSRPFTISKVLLATDCRPGSLAPLYASAIAAEFAASLTVLCVGQEPTSSHAANTQLIRQELASIAPELASLSPETLFVRVIGEPAEKILQTAETMDADLIVLGAHHPANIRTASHVPWATTSQVIARSSCPVITIGETSLCDRNHRSTYSAASKIARSLL